MSTLCVVPLTLGEAQGVIALWHRHLSPPIGHRFSIGAVKDGRVVGACIVGHPTSREIDQSKVAEVTRCATDGSRNACSLLYGAAARAAKAMGYHKIQTYNLDIEGGPSLHAAGYVRVKGIPGREWIRSDGALMKNENTTDAKGRWERILNESVPTSYLFPMPPGSRPQLSFEVAS